VRHAAKRVRTLLLGSVGQGYCHKPYEIAVKCGFSILVSTVAFLLGFRSKYSGLSRSIGRLERTILVNHVT
jgi:hypothetical protein